MVQEEGEGMIWLSFIPVAIWIAWSHRGGRKCCKNCHCEDFL